MSEIKKLYAYVTDNPEGEGIITMQMPNGQVMPAVTSNIVLLKQVLPNIEQYCKAAGKSFKILEFSKREDVTKEFAGKIIKP